MKLGHDLHRRRAGLPLAAMAACATALASPAATAASPTPISGATPYSDAACDNETLGGTLYKNSEVEPWVDVNPTDARNMIAVYQQDRFSNGGSRGNAASYTTNGGARWTTVTFPELTRCTGGSWARATDPWLTFSPNGHAYAMSLVFDNFPLPDHPGDAAANAMVVQKSTDGGRTWSSPPIELIKDTNARLFNDKNSMTADPNNSNYVYAVWDRLNSSLGGLIHPENVLGLGYKGPALFTRTTNGGISWEPPRAIYDPAGNNQTIGNQIVVLPQSAGGTVYDFFNEILNFKNSDGGSQFDFNLDFLYSNDKGATWLPGTKPRRVQKIQSLAQFRAFGTCRTIRTSACAAATSCSTWRSTRATAACTRSGRMRGSAVSRSTRSPSRSRPTAVRPGRCRSGSI